MLSTLGALYRDFDALSHSRRLRCCDCREAFVLSLFAGLAPLWFVFQSLVVEENLFTRSPDEVLVTVYAFDKAILIFTFVSHFQCLGGFRLCHGLLPWSVCLENIMPGRANKYRAINTLVGLPPMRVKDFSP